MTLDEAIAYDASPTGYLACEPWCAAVGHGHDCCRRECDCGMERARAVVATLQAAVANYRAWWCPARKHRRTHGERLRDADCRECAIEASRAQCGHPRGAQFSHHAGILGNRFACPDCGASMPDPEEGPPVT